MSGSCSDTSSTHPFIRISDDTTPSTPTQPSSPSSHLIDIIDPPPPLPACHLLATPAPVRSKVLDYLDDTSAIQYLSTCKSTHTGYHDYPVKRAMSVESLTELFKLPVYYRYRRHVTLYTCMSFVLLLVMNNVRARLDSRASMDLSYNILFASIVVGWLCLVVRAAVVHRTDCCAKGRRVDTLRGWYSMPRVTRLSGELTDMRLLRFLQHLSELEVTCRMERPVGHRYPLPRSLVSLRLHNSSNLTLESDTLPPRLTSLSLAGIKNSSIPAGVLPQSLTSLHLTYAAETQWPVKAEGLPSSLQRLQVSEWKLPLSDVDLPASLIELDVHCTQNFPLPVLPPQLQVLRIAGVLDQPLTGVLPSSLRTLHLLGSFGQPLTADLFASVPQLEELYLDDHSCHQLAADVLPRSLRVLRLGKRDMTELHSLPSQLRRVIVPACWDGERVKVVEQVGQTRGFSVEQPGSVCGRGDEKADL